MKQAVVVVHGMGEQRPMATVRAFVEAVWTHDTTLDVLAGHGERRVWMVPDTRFGSHEMSRIRTNRLALERDRHGDLQPGPATDFFELYWQDRMGTSRWQHVTGWLVPLLGRSPRRVPEPLRTPWRVLVGATLVVALCFAEPVLANLFGKGPFEWLLGADVGGLARAALTGLTALLGFLGARFVLPYIGDAARYLDPAPGNVAVRNRIRDEGVRLLRALNDSGEYDRIVVVGHSLGSVIAYDALRILWSETVTPRTTRRAPALAAMEDAARDLREADTAAHRAAYDRAQRDFQAFLGAGGETDHPRWRITDFVTLGSPLAHADVLLARDRRDFDRMVAERGLPVSPPLLETVRGEERFTFRTKGDDARWQTHHAAVFAAVRWTNLYFPYDGFLEGDMVGGPLRPLFGAGVRDVPVRSSAVRGLSCHTHYWTMDGNVGEHVVALRAALDLGRSGA
jgi:hypothetical protein